MKSPVAYYLFLLYLTVIAKPFLPVAADWWAHTFDEARHMALVHAKYGSHHLQNEVAAGSNADHNKDQGTLKPDDIVFFHLSPTTCLCHFPSTPLRSPYLFYTSVKLPLALRRIQIPPPKVG